MTDGHNRLGEDQDMSQWLEENGQGVLNGAPSLSPEALEELGRLYAAATPGQWQVTGSRSTFEVRSAHCVGPDGDPVFAVLPGHPGKPNEIAEALANGRFIAAAHREMPALLAAASRERDLVRERDDYQTLSAGSVIRAREAEARATASEAREADLIRRAETAEKERDEARAERDEMEQQRDDARSDPWPEWTTRIIKTLESFGVEVVDTEICEIADFGDAFDEWFRESLAHETNRADTATAQIAALQERVGVLAVEVSLKECRRRFHKTRLSKDISVDPDDLYNLMSALEDVRSRLSAEPATGGKEGGA